MSLFPPEFDLRDDVISKLDLVEFDTPDGVSRFGVGFDAKFTDTSGNDWWGSQLISAGSLEYPTNGEAPEMSVTLSYFQDPDADDVVAQVRAMGLEYLKGRAVRFYVQPIGQMTHFQAPTMPPILIATRYVSSLSVQFEGDLSRSITIGVEGAFAARRTARGWNYTTTDHAVMLGSSNPSLELMPTNNRVLESLLQ